MATAKSKKKIKKRRVTFSVELADAREVTLMGDFNKWNPKKHAMRKNGKGVWIKAVIIPPGQYEYKFLADGHWLEDPQNSQRRINLFGTYNSIVHVYPA